MSDEVWLHLRGLSANGEKIGGDEDSEGGKEKLNRTEYEFKQRDPPLVEYEDSIKSVGENIGERRYLINEGEKGEFIRLFWDEMEKMGVIPTTADILMESIAESKFPELEGEEWMPERATGREWFEERITKLEHDIMQLQASLERLRFDRYERQRDIGGDANVVQREIEEKSQELASLQEMKEKGSVSIHQQARYLPMHDDGVNDLILDRLLMSDWDLERSLIKEMVVDGILGMYHPSYGIVLNLPKIWSAFNSDVEKWNLEPVARRAGWKAYLAFVINHETFHYWTERAAVYGARGNPSLYNKYAMRVPDYRCNESLDNDVCYFDRGVLHPHNIGRLSNIGITMNVENCPRRCEHSTTKGYQFPLEEAMANAFAIRRLNNPVKWQRAGRQRAINRSVKNFIRSINTNMQFGYANFPYFQSDKWFNAGLRDLTSMIYGEIPPEVNAMHDLRIRRNATACKEAAEQSLRFGSPLGLYGSLDRSARQPPLPLKVICGDAKNLMENNYLSEVWKMINDARKRGLRDICD